MLKPLPLRGKSVTNFFRCASSRWISISNSIGVWNALQKKQHSTNIPSRVRRGSCIRLRGNIPCNSRDREPLFLKLSITHLEYE